MLILSTVAAGLAILILALILGYTLVHGISYLNLDSSRKPPSRWAKLAGVCVMNFRHADMVALGDDHCFADRFISG